MAKVAPEFEVVTRPRTAIASRPRRSWIAVIDALVAGRRLYLPDEDLTDRDVKYLQLALARRGKGERLRTERTARKGLPGRDLWAVKDEGGTVVPVIEA